jgi:multiple sugar transport system ATP-binding protein
MNMAEAEVAADDEGYRLVFGEHRIDLGTADGWPGLRSLVGTPLVVGIRPEDFEDASLVEASADRRIRVRVDLKEVLGSEVLVHFTIRAPEVRTEQTLDLAAPSEDARALQGRRNTEGGTSEFVARLSPRTAAEEGRDLELAVDADRLHFFDRDTGEAIAARPNEGS